MVGLLAPVPFPAGLLSGSLKLPDRGVERGIGALVAQERDEQSAYFCNELGYNLNLAGDYAGARSFYERALVIFEKALGPDHLHTKIVRSKLDSLP